MDWSEEDTARLKSYIDEGLSSTATSRKFEGKYSRNACIGKAMRKGWRFHSVRRPPNIKPGEKKPRIRLPALPIKYNWPESSETAITFDEIKAGKCRWPLWDIAAYEEQRYCGGDAKCGPYCIKHFAVAYRGNGSRRAGSPKAVLRASRQCPF